MKTIKTYFPVLLILLFTGTGILSAQPEKNQDKNLNPLIRVDEKENLNDLSFNTTAIASEALFQKLEENYFSKENEEKVAPLPFNAKKIARQYRYEKLEKLVFQQEAEPEIDDLPPAVKKFMADYRQKPMAQNRHKSL